jgi:hypothetical protein
MHPPHEAYDVLDIVNAQHARLNDTQGLSFLLILPVEIRSVEPTTNERLPMARR